MINDIMEYKEVIIALAQRQFPYFKTLVNIHDDTMMIEWSSLDGPCSKVVYGKSVLT